MLKTRRCSFRNKVFRFVLAAIGSTTGAVLVHAQEATSIHNPILQIQAERAFQTLVVPVQINGGETIRCILDTGMPEGVFLLNPKAAEGLDLDGAITAQLRGAGSETKTAKMVMGANLQLGDLQFENQRVIIMDDPGALADIGVDGAIGASVFLNYVAEMNLETNTLTLYEPSQFDNQQAGESLPLRMEGTKPYLKVAIDVNGGEEIEAELLVDTGSGQNLSLNEKVDSALGPPGEVIGGTLGAGVGGEIIGVVGRVSALRLGSKTLNRVVAAFPDEPGPDGKGTVGMGVLERFHVTIDYPNRRLFLRPNGLFDDGFEFDMTGMMLRPAGQNRLRVQHVVADSPADRAGIQKDDVILSINGKPTNFAEYSRLDRLFKQPGERVEIEFERDGDRQEVTLEQVRLI